MAKIDVDFFTGVSISDNDIKTFKQKFYAHRWYEEHKERKRFTDHKWCEENTDQLQAYKHKWYEENKVQTKTNSRQWYRENPEKVKDINYRRNAKKRKGTTMKEKKYHFYLLYNPRFPSDIKYVGITSMSLRQRLISHLQAKRRNNALKYDWLFGVKKSTVEVGIAEFLPDFTVTDRQEAEYLERLLIHECLRDGFTLLNIQGIPGDQQKFATHLKSLDNNTVEGFFEQIFQLIKRIVEI